MRESPGGLLPPSPLDRLPLFATDRQLAIAIAGLAGADHWKKVVLPALLKKGFPVADALHGMRAVPLVRKFYEGYFGITAGFAMAPPDGEERLGMFEWRNRNKAPSPDGEPAEDRRVAAKRRSDAWQEKKRLALEEYRAKSGKASP